MSLSVQCRYAALLAFSQSRSDDCGRQGGGRFGPKNTCQNDGEGGSASSQTYAPKKPTWMGKVDASGSSKHGDWFLEKNEKGSKSPGHGEVTSHVVRLVGSDGTVKAFSYADLSDDGKDLYVNYSEVAEPFRGKGVYKSLLDSMSDKFRVTSDDQHNVASAAKKAYESLGARVNQYGQYVIDKKRRNSRAFCATGDGGGIDNSCGGDSVSKKSDAPSRGYDALPNSFPSGSEKFRDAVDSVSPDPKSIWDRARGRADTPPDKVMRQAADEQASSGSSLTPEAEKAYGSLVDEIGRQYEALVEAGLKVRAWRGEGEPYGDPPGSTKPNSDNMRAEVGRTGEFSFFMTEKGFGTGQSTPDHPMLRETKYKTADGEPMIANDLFRVVHDMVAHVRGGYSFSTNGEYNGMLTHASTLPEAAWPALFAETFGQNAVYEKTGNYAQQNAYASTVGPEIIRQELAKRNRKSSRDADSEGDSDEPLGYQHIKSRPWLLAAIGGEESRSADCGRDGSGRFGSGNKCQTVYHGTDSEDPESLDFNEVAQSKNSFGILGNVDVTRHGVFFSDSKDFSSEYGKNVGEFSLDAKKVADLSPLPGNWHSPVVEEFVKSLDPRGPDRDLWATAYYSQPSKPWLLFDDKIGKKFTDWLRSNGYDAARFPEESESGKSGTTFVALDKKKIRPKKQSRSADCGRDEGGKFGSGNKCASEGDGQPSEVVTKLRAKDGKQSDTARQMYSMGMTERKLASLIEKLGGSPKASNVKSNINRLNIHVVDKSGKRVAFIEFRRSGVRVYPMRELSGDEAKKFESVAKEHFPKEYDKKGTPFTVKVFTSPDAIKDWEKENDAKYKAIEDKYKTSVYLPPYRRPKKRSLSVDCHVASLMAFAASRNCGTGAGGFQKGNTCAGGVIADAAKGAAKGAAIGVAAGAAKTFSPQGAAAGAASGVVAGAIKGVYDNKMRPTRVSERIKHVGMTDEKVAGLVKGLGGTDKSSAHLDGSNSLSIKVRSPNGKVTHVVDVTDKKIVVYPRVAADRMSDNQIAKIKEIAKSSSPKETQVKVKTDSLAYVRRLAKKGIIVTGKEAGLLVATVVVSGHAPLAGAAVMGTADLVFDTHFTDSFHKKRK